MWYENGTFTSGDSRRPRGAPAAARASTTTRRFQTGTFDVGGCGGTIYYPEAERSFRQADLRRQPRAERVAPRRGRSSRSPRRSRGRTRASSTYDHGRTCRCRRRASTTASSSARPLPPPVRSPGSSGSTAPSMARRYDNGLARGRRAGLGVGVQLGRLVGRSGHGLHQLPVRERLVRATRQSRAHQVLLGAPHQPKRGLSLEIAGGAAYLLPAEVWYPAGSAAHQRAAAATRASPCRTSGTSGRPSATAARRSATSAAPRSRGRRSTSFSFSRRVLVRVPARRRRTRQYTIRSQVAERRLQLGQRRRASPCRRATAGSSNQTEGLPARRGRAGRWRRSPTEWNGGKGAGHPSGPVRNIMAMKKVVRIDALPESAWRYAGYDAIVCIDVLLSSTTIVTALAQGRRVFAAPDPGPRAVVPVPGGGRRGRHRRRRARGRRGCATPGRRRSPPPRAARATSSTCRPSPR